MESLVQEGLSRLESLNRLSEGQAGGYSMPPCLPPPCNETRGSLSGITCPVARQIPCKQVSVGKRPPFSNNKSPTTSNVGESGLLAMF